VSASFPSGEVGYGLLLTSLQLTKLKKGPGSPDDMFVHHVTIKHEHSNLDAIPQIMKLRVCMLF
jgi:hypothetical protein